MRVFGAISRQDVWSQTFINRMCAIIILVFFPKMISLSAQFCL